MNTLLLASPALGAVWLVVLFIVVFLLVHAVKLARLGLRVQPPSKPPTDEAPAPKEAPPKKDETPKKRPARSLGSVYYIVEKKRRTEKKD